MENHAQSETAAPSHGQKSSILAAPIPGKLQLLKAHICNPKYKQFKC